MSEALAIPGRGSKSPALVSLLRFGYFFNKKSYSWPKKKAAECGAPVFFANLGMHCAVVTDVVAASHIFGLPTDVSDRLGNMGFGPLVLRPQIVGPIEPALVASDESNAESRHFINTAMRSVMPKLDESMAQAMEAVANDWASRGTVPLAEMKGISGRLMGKWLMDIDLDLIEVGKWPKLAVTLTTSSGLLNGLLKHLAGPKKADIELSDRLKEMFRTAPGADHIRAIARETGVSDEDGLLQIAFVTLFNTGGHSLLLARALAQLAVAPQWAATIRDEVGDTRLTLDNVNDFRNLRNVFFEVSRMFSGPRLFYRVAKSAFELPCGNGKNYQVEKDDVLLILKRSIHYDEQKFQDPTAFRPDRFDNDPDLLNYLFIFGPHEKPYRCVTRDLGFGATLFMYTLARLLQGWDWELSPKPTLDPDRGDVYAPDDLKMANFRART